MLDETARVILSGSMYIRELHGYIVVFLGKQPLEQSRLAGLTWAGKDDRRKLPGGEADLTLGRGIVKPFDR